MGKQYRFFVELTEQVERLRARLTNRPGALVHRGLDLSHAFARQLYFAAVADEALYALWARTQGLAMADGGRLSGSAMALLAQDWFGADAARTVTPRAVHLRALAAPLRLLAGRGGGRKPLPDAPPILLFAHSLRFARFLGPVAQKLGARCAYLVAAGDAATRQWAVDQGHAVREYHPAAAGIRRSGAVLARHAPGLALLAEELETALAASGARVVLVPEGNAPIDEVVSRVGRRNGIAVACLQQGWSPLVHTGFRNMSYAAVLTWGEGFAALLRPHNPGQDFRVTGNGHLPAASPSKPGVPGLAIFCQGGGGWLDDGDEKLLLKLAARIASDFPNLSVSVRSHPVAPFSEETRRYLGDFANVRISDPEQEPLADVLARSSAAVSIYSSTILESLAMGVVPVIFNMTTMPRYIPDVAGLGAGIEVHDFEAAHQALALLLSKPDNLEAHRARMRQAEEVYFPYRGDLAVSRVVGELEDMVIKAL